MAPYRSLIFAWAAMMLLLALTVGASFALTGAPSLFAGVAIAAGKAALVLWFFMEIRRDGGLIRVFSAGAVVWLIVLIGLTLADVLSRAA